jgi:hypothetical protein
MTKKNTKTFVSGSDHRYFPLLLEWIYSVKSHAKSKDIDICIINAGMTNDQCEKLKPLVNKLIEIEWPCPIPSNKIKGKEYLKACVARPWIPELFPEYDTYFWMDADTWIQNWDAIELFFKGAEKNAICLTGQVDRAYPRQIRVKWLGKWPWKVRGFYFSNARRAFGFKTAKKLLPYHVLLAGAFCLKKDAPHWEHWQSLVRKAVVNGKVFTAEQTSLGVMCYLDNFKFEILPGWCHWLCEFKPLWDEGNQKFIEPYLPHNEIGILHLSGFDELRLDRSLTTDFKTLTGKEVELNYRYPDFDGES